MPSFRDSYGAWAERLFGDAGQLAAQSEADPDADGLSNLAEFGLGLDPGVWDRGALESPFLTPTGELALVYFRPYLSAATRVVPEVSSDLLFWEAGPESVSESVIWTDAEGEWVQAEDLYPYDGVTPRFIRLRVEAN